MLGIAAGAAIGDCGSQDFAASQIEDLNQALHQHFGAEPFPTGKILAAAEVLNRLGMDYTAFDVDGRKGTVYLDFHSLRFPRDLYGKFDATFNAGTSEHLFVPSGLFFFMHQATKVGGLMWHNVPIFGMGNHGLTNHTPKFWHQIAAYNQYEIVKSNVVPVDSSLIHSGNFYGDHLSGFNGLKEMNPPSAMIEIIFRRRFPYCFVPPFDIEDPLQPARNERLMRGALQPFIDAGSLQYVEADQAMDWHFGRPVTEIKVPPPSLLQRFKSRVRRIASRHTVAHNQL